MAIYVLIDEATDIIVNRLVLDDPADWPVPAGHALAEEGDVPMAIGGTLDVNGVYTPPPQPEPILPPPPAPAPEDIVLYDHENRLRAIEGEPPLELGEFMAKKRQPA
jgi:hypothetical protein